jgi:hypothetical protein
MNENEEITPLLPAYSLPRIPAKMLKNLVALQLAMSKATITKTGRNKHLGNNYATLDDIIEVLMPLASENKIVILQIPMESPARRAGVITVVADAESGEQFEFSCEVAVAQDNVQGYGGGLTYASRYALMRLFMLRGEVDDDGNTAAGRVIEQSPEDPVHASPKPSILARPNGIRPVGVRSAG